MEPSPWNNFETLQLHAGNEPDPVTRSTAVPIYATSVRASSHLYDGTYTKLACLLPRYNITTKFVQSAKPADFAAAIDDNTKAIYIESISNPDLLVPDFEAITKVAHDHGIPLIVSYQPVLATAIELEKEDKEKRSQ